MNESLLFEQIVEQVDKALQKSVASKTFSFATPAPPVQISEILPSVEKIDKTVQQKLVRTDSKTRKLGEFLSSSQAKRKKEENPSELFSISQLKDQVKQNVHNGNS